MSTHRNRIAPLLLAAGLVGAFSLALPAVGRADALDAAKAAGLVCEQPDGYLRTAAANPTAELVDLVESINTKRRAAYEQSAAEAGTTAEAVGATVAQKPKLLQNACH